MRLSRTALNLLAAATALAALTGVAALNAPTSEADGDAEAARLPVQRSSLVCPQPGASELANTTYTGYTAPHGDAASGDAGERKADDSAGLVPAEDTLEGGGQGSDDDNDDNDGGSDDEDSEDSEGSSEGKDPDPVLPLKKPGTPVLHETDRTDAPALTGSAEGSLAPGWAVQQSTTISAGAGRGLLGLRCTAPDTDFLFTGVSTAQDRHDYIHLTNPDEAPATVDLELYGKKGQLTSDSGRGLNIPGGATVPVLLSTLTSEPTTNVSLHVAVRAGRVGAQVQAVDKKLGSDWITASARSDEQLVLPGIPSDAEEVRLVAFTPGERDVELGVKFAGPNSSISPAGGETLNVRGGMTTAVDLKDLTRGEPGALVLAPTEEGRGAPVIATLRVLRGDGSDQEMAFIPASEPVRDRATAAGSQMKGSTLSLTAPGSAAKVKVTASAGSDGGKAVTKSYDLKAGTTTAIDDLRPDGGKGRFALTVERVSGGAVHVARMLETKDSSSEDVPMFTVQTYPDDRSTVSVPDAGQDLNVLNGRG